MSDNAALSPASVAVLTALLEARTGQQVASYRSWRVDTALKPLMRERKLPSLDQLVCHLLDGSDPPLAEEVVDALVNKETSFFRDVAMFDMAAEVVAAAEARGRRARIWSAGCATGQEPLSLAMMFAERQEDTGVLPPEIVATDVSESALARARQGRFSQFEIQRGLPIRRMMRWFDSADNDWIAHPDLVKMVSFRRQNLVSDQPPAGRFDLVMCRNVLLYLSPAIKEAVFAKLAGALRAEGSLVMGAGETVIGQTSLFVPSRRFRGLYDREPGIAPVQAVA